MPDAPAVTILIHLAETGKLCLGVGATWPLALVQALAQMRKDERADAYGPVQLKLPFDDDHAA